MVKILFITYPEYGCSGVILSVIADLRTRYPQEAEIHISSFSNFQQRCPEILSDPKIHFHPLSGLSLTQSYVSNKSENEAAAVWEDLFANSTKIWNWFGSVHRMFQILLPYTPAQYLETTKEIEGIIEGVDPELVVLDPMFQQCRDACIRLKRETLLLCPNTLLEVAGAYQEAKIFNYPAVGSGLPYPMNWYHRWLNAFYYIYIGIYTALLDPRGRAINKIRNKAGYPGNIPLFEQKKEAPLLCMSTPTVEFPMEIPPDVICCGPIVQASPPLSSEGQSLMEWVAQKPTILVCLGSLHKMTELDAVELYYALQGILEKRPDLQVLWKLQRRTPFELPGEKGLERMRIEKWLEVDLITIMRGGNVICSVNHGGSNSYHEALGLGIPQIIISGWYDCHEFGTRLEWLKNGRWGNKRAAPGCDRKELDPVFAAVVGATPSSPSAKTYAETAKTYAIKIEEHAQDMWQKLFEEKPVGTKEVGGSQIAGEFVMRRAQGVPMNGGKF